MAGGKKIIFLVLFLGLIAVAITLFDIPSGNPTRTCPKIRILTANIGHCSLNPTPRYEEIVQVLKIKPQPDIIFLQDIRSPSQVQRLAHELNYPYWCTDSSSRENSADLAILSKEKLSQISYHPLAASRGHKGILSAQIKAGSSKIFLGCVHLDRIKHTPRLKDNEIVFSWSVLLKQLYREMFTSTVRSRSVQEIISWLNKIDKTSNIVLGGDFNTVLPSLAIIKMTRAFEDALWPSLDFFRGTYQPLDFFIKPRIDYIFHSKDLKCLSAEIIRFTAGDHYPILSVFKTRT